jgi:hypothetical protein
MRIYGAGMAGLLAAGMLRRFSPVVCEAQNKLPDNHGALLRFRSEAVPQATGQPFQKVRVLKAIKADGRLHFRADVRLSNLYSLKVTGRIATRSILDTEPVDRYIAPPEFIATMAAGVDLRYSEPLTRDRLEEHKEAGEPVISTIPMNLLMDIVGWDHRPEFSYQGITSARLVVRNPPVDVFQTIYYPEPQALQYRASLTGNLLTIEYMGMPEDAGMYQLASILDDFGINPDAEFTRLPVSFQRYGKLLPIEEKVRRAFILAMTDQFHVYSVGRFATWRQILLDDVVKDVSMVSRWVTERDTYSRHLHFGE